MSTGRSKRFQKTIVDWLRTNTALVSFSSHTSLAPRIFFANPADDLETEAVGSTPCVTVNIQHFGGIERDVDAGPFRSQIQVTCWGFDALGTSDAADAVYEHARQQVNGKDAGITTANSIRVTGVKALAPLFMQAAPDDPESDVVGSAAVLLITWYDTAS
jgi:hypothetical protein